MTNPSAKMKKVGRLAPSFSVISARSPAASVVPRTTAATVVFLMSAMSVDPSGAIEPRKACGQQDLSAATARRSARSSGRPPPGRPGPC